MVFCMQSNFLLRTLHGELLGVDKVERFCHGNENLVIHSPRYTLRMCGSLKLHKAFFDACCQTAAEELATAENSKHAGQLACLSIHSVTVLSSCSSTYLCPNCTRTAHNVMRHDSQLNATRLNVRWRQRAITVEAALR